MSIVKALKKNVCPDNIPGLQMKIQAMDLLG
ncbi:MAG: hypothetical protein Ct9H90mP18_02620 [Gammaproteobacteria bacterium]|nr:MAG: hypothetical protein Ct9H90mP18_02620 [Gammaproteobacteria bacterium]